MKLIRDVRNKHYEETKGMNSTELLNFYKQKQLILHPITLKKYMHNKNKLIRFTITTVAGFSFVLINLSK
jgi:hypothetical protein